MAKSSGEIEREFINGLKNSSGKSLEEWVQTLSDSGIEKRNDQIKWLKERHSFGHLNASLLAGIFANGGKPVYESESLLLDNQFQKYPEMRSLYNTIADLILSRFPDAEIVVKKTYISFIKKREFIALNVKNGELRLGLDLGDRDFTPPAEKAKLTGPMPRISHMIILKSATDLTDEIFELIQSSNERVNG